MKILGTIFVAVSLLFAHQAVAENANADTWKTHTTLTSSDLRAIEHALPEVHRRRPDWSDYQISVIETDTSLLVSFWRTEDAGAVTITRPQPNGSPAQIVGTMPRVHNELVVELDKKTFRIIDVSNVGK